MEDSTVAHALPELYLAVLERAASLEGADRRAEALVIRRAAVAAYSRAFDLRASHQLEALLVRADRILDGPGQPRGEGSHAAAVGWSKSA